MCSTFHGSGNAVRRKTFSQNLGKPSCPRTPRNRKGARNPARLKQRLTYILQDSLQPIQKLLSPEAVKQFLAGPLPSDPLTASALIQVNYWLLHYGIYLKL